VALPARNHDEPSPAALIERSAELKRALVGFALSPRFERQMERFVLESGSGEIPDEGEAIDAIDRMPRFRVTGAGAREALLNQQIACKNHAYEFGTDPDDINNWEWPF